MTPTKSPSPLTLTRAQRVALASGIGTYDFRARYPRPVGPGDAEALGRFLAEMVTSPVLVARDTRRASLVFSKRVSAGFRAAGARPVSLGIAPSAVTGFAARHFGLSALVATPSHNPVGYVGLKGFDPSGRLWSEEWDRTRSALRTGHAVRGLKRRVRQAARPVRSATRSLVRDAYLKAIERVGRSGARIVVDPRGGAASHWCSAALERLGAEVIRIDDAPSPVFHRRSPEPSAKDIGQLAATVRRRSADFGVTLDGDGDRLVCVDERGIALPPEAVALALSSSDSTDRGRLVASADLSPRLGAFTKVTYCPRGSRNVESLMRRIGAGVGVELSDHFYLARTGFLSDGIFVAAILARSRTVTGDPISAFARPFEPMSRVQLDIGLPVNYTRLTRPYPVLPGLSGRWRRYQDGIELRRGVNRRAFLRLSRTESKLRATLESWHEAPAGEDVRRIERALRDWVDHSLIAR